MTAVQPPAVLKLLAHGVRWRLVQALAHGDARGLELAQLVGRPPNLVSYHLRRLRDQHLIRQRRSAADGRDVYYQLDLERVARLYRAAAAALHPGLAPPVQPPLVLPAAKRDRPVRVLFLCTHNSARSQMAEGLLRHRGGRWVEAHSAGTEPAALQPLAVEVMAERGIDLTGQSAKHLSTVLGQSFDHVITVCDRAREACPAFAGAVEQVHWSIPDPVAVRGRAARRRAFVAVAAELSRRVDFLLLMLGRE